MIKFRIATAPILLLLLGTILGACVPRATASGGGGTNQLSRDQFARYSTVMEAVESLRSNWLRQRSPHALTNEHGPTPDTTPITRPLNPVWVYRDGIRVGGPEVLERLSPAEIEIIEHYDATRASLRWGQNHENGAIHLTSRSRDGRDDMQLSN